ncbi:MAG: alpha/beta hydrolase [Gammaproteobacteria bacterium]
MRHLKLLLSLFCLLPGLGLAAASSPSAASSDLPAASATFTVGTLRVQQYGNRGRALILIPGLSSGPWAWQGTIVHFKKDHVIYALTLAGFDGTPAPKAKTGFMTLADKSLIELIRSHHIDKPVLVGHSLGATLAIRFATEHSDLISGVVAVDGLPVFPLMSASQREATAQQMRQLIGHMSQAEFKAQQLRFMQTIGLVDQDRARHYAALSADSDPDVMYEYAAEDMELDLRPQLKSITVPLLEISPYYKPDYVRYAKLNNRPLTTAKQKADYYRQLLDGVPHVRVISIEGARHFVMLDQPQKFFAILSSFLTGLAK